MLNSHFQEGAYTMFIIPSNHCNDQQISNLISRFLSDFNIGRLLRTCGCTKEKGIPVMVLFTYILSNVFRDRSLYMQQRTGHCKENFSKNAYYRFMNNTHANWLRFTTMLSAHIINGHLRTLTTDQRTDCFVIDDSLYERAGFKRTELASRVFDHVSMTFKKGYRLMTLGWTDGASFIPINASLLASSKDEHILGKAVVFDKRSLAGKRRDMARQKGTTVMIELLQTARKAGHTAKYVLFDSWFSNPRQIVQIHEIGLHTIAMVKISSKIRYLYHGDRKNIKQIYASNKKRRGRSRYLLSIPVQVGPDTTGTSPIDARIVCVRNRANRKDWIALICTDMTLSEEEIIRIYGKRWDIEVFFKTCKSFLRLGTEYHGLSYDALTAHVAFVFTRFMLLSVAKRNDEDERTLGELFYLMIDELADITFNTSMQLLMDAMIASIATVLHATKEQIAAVTQDFISRIPDYMKSALQSDRAALAYEDIFIF